MKYKVWTAVIIILAIALGYFVYSTNNPENRFRVHYGLDLSGGTHLVYDADVSDVPSGQVDESMRALRSAIERRVNVFGVSEPIVQTEKGGFGSEIDHRLIVELPGISDVDEATALIGRTPVLEFRLVNEEAGVIGGVATVTPGEPHEIFMLTGLGGDDVESASLQFGAGGGGIQNEPVVLLDFNQEGSNLFAEITRNNVGGTLAIFLDGQTLSMPVIQEEIPGGQAQISGNFTPDEARELVRDLNLGALPVPIELISTQSIGASLGEEARDAGITAGLLGLVALSIFLIFWYRLPGLIAVVALAIYFLVMVSLFKLIPVVLTAAGIAGFILSIGMAVDANVLIFERIKEELGMHGDMKKAIRVGFSRAWPSIRDGNVSSIITAIILFYIVGTSLTKGFALVWGMGVIISMLTAITISRTFLLALAGEKFEGRSRFLYDIGFSKSLSKEA